MRWMRQPNWPRRLTLDTADFDNGRHIAEEIGDVLLTVAMLTQIAAEEGRFQLADVARGITQKLIRRHPHVFGERGISTASTSCTPTGDAIKAQEKAERGEVAGPLDGIPAALPALEKARKLQSKARKAGLLDGDALLTEAAWLNERLADEEATWRRCCGRRWRWRSRAGGMRRMC